MLVSPPAAGTAADGYVLLFVPGTTSTINPLVYSSLGFDPKKDLAPIIKNGSVPGILVVNSTLRVLAVLSAARSSVLPDVPTTKEAGTC